MPASTFVLDTNVLISAFLFQNSLPARAFKQAVETGIILRSTETFEEFTISFLRNKFAPYLSFHERIELINAYKQISLPIKVTVPVTICRDPKDNKFLELAFAVNASCIITGDKDLLVLHPFMNIGIFSPADFLNSF
jgi:uncharacterized protein